MEQNERSTKLDRAIYFYIFLNILKCAFQLTDCSACQFATNKSTLSALVEWNHFSDRIHADSYLITYGTLSPRFSSTVRSVHGLNIILDDLLENLSYYFTIKSVTNGKISDSKSFTTCLLGEVGIKTNVSTTTVTFDWSDFGIGRFLTTISLNSTSYIVPPTTNNYIWNHLKPGTLYNFSLEFKQSHHAGLTLTQVFYMIIETAPCPPGWIGSFYSCYWIRKDYKKWKDASHLCELAANTVHLIDINTEEEYKFISSHLRSLNDFSMLWTGLNDIDTENELQWTDRTAFNLSTILLQTLPSNESDCYALQLNPLGPDYVLTELFCFLALPYVCEYEVLVLPKTIKLKSEDVKENEATILWDDLQDLFSSMSELFIWYQPNSDEENQHSNKILLNETQVVISGLKPGHHYYFALMMRDNMGIQRTVSPVLNVKTRPNPPRNITAGEVTSSSLQLLWVPPEKSLPRSFHHYLVSFMPVKSRGLVTEDVERDKTSVVLRNLKPFQSYEIYVQAVTEGGSLSCAEGPLFASTDPSPPVSIYIDNADVWENTIIVHWEPPLEGCNEYHLRIQMSNKSSEVKEYSVINTTLFQFDFMIPGATYDIEVMAVKSGKRSKPKFITQTTKPQPVEIVFPIDVQTHSTVLYVGMPKIGLFDGVIVTYGDGNKIISTSKRDFNITIENLVPGEEYSFAVYSNSGNMKSKVYRVPIVKTYLVPPTNLREGKVTETSLELLWDKAEGHFNQYEVLCLNCDNQLVVQKVKQEYAVFTKLTPGKLYNISLRTEKENYQDSVPVKQLIRTLPSPVEYLDYNKTSDSITLSWPEPACIFDGYNLTLSSKVMHQVVEVPFTQSRTYHYDKLMPGTTYSITIETTSATKKSHPTTIIITTFPEPPVDLQFVEQDENSVYLFWKAPRGDFDIFELRYNLPGINETTYRTTLCGNNFRVKDLIPGVEYVFQIKTVKGVDVSEVIEKRLKTKPENPQMLEVSNILATGFTLHWRAPVGNDGNYKVDLIPDQGFVNITNLGDGSFKADVFDATPGIKYTITVSSVSSSFSKSVSRSFTTNETYAVSPDGLAVGLIGATAIMLAWNVPSHPNGRILSYMVEYKEVCPVQQADFIQVSTHAETTEFLLNNLKPGAAYKIRVAAENSAGIGAFSTFRQVVTAESAPGPVLSLTATAVNHTAANVTWFLPKRPNGKITHFSIIIKSVRSGHLSKNISVNAEALFPSTLLQCEVSEKSLKRFFHILRAKVDDSPTSTTPGALISSSPPSNVFLAATSGYLIHDDPSPEFASIVVDQLKPYTTYLCEVSAFTKEGEGQAASALFRTPEWIPEEPPQNLIVSKITSRSFVISWDPPPTITGRLFYRVGLINPLGQISQNSTREMTYIFTNLLPFTKYEVFAIAETVVGPGPKASVKVTTSSEVPGEVFDLKATEVESKSAKIEWGKPRQPNGKIIQYQIIVLLLESQLSVQNITLTPENLQEIKNSTESIYPGTLVTDPYTLTSENDAIIITDVDEGSAELLSESPSLEPAVTSSTSPIEKLITVSSDLSGTSTIHEKSLAASLPDQLTSHKQIFSSPLTYTKTALSSTMNSMPAAGSTTSFTKQTTVSPMGPLDSLSTVSMNFKLRSMLHRRSVIPVVKAGGISLPPSSSPFLPLWRLLPNGLQNITKESEISLQVIDPSSEQLSYVVRELVPYTDYIIRVSAFTIVGEGPPSSISLKTQQYVPSSVRNITYKNLTSTSILILWDPPAIPNGIITHYTLYAVEEGTTEAFQRIVMSNNITLTGLKKFTKYKMRVTASTSVGESAVSGEDDVFVQTLEDEPETPPENLTFNNITATSVHLSWSTPERPNGIIIYYEIMYANYTDSFVLNSTATNIYLENLKSFSPYNISVKAYTKYGHGNQTSLTALLLTEQGIPDSAPENITYIFIAPLDIIVSFLPPSTPNGIIQYYTLYLAAKNNSEQFTAHSTNLSITITGLSANENYTLTISASTSKGEGIKSQPVYILTGEGVPGSPPRSLTSKQLSSTTVRLSWKPPLEPNGVILYYTVHIWSAMTQLILNETGTSVLLKDLVNVEYHAFVTASTKFGNGGMKSNNITFRTSESLNPEGTISYVNRSSTSIQVFWNHPFKPAGNVQFYIVHYRNISGDFTQNITDFEQDINDDNVNVSVILVNLTKFSHYKLWMIACSTLTDEIQTSELIDIYTDEDVPSAPPQDLMIINHTADSVLVRWKPSPMPNGIVMFYSLKIIDNTNENIYFKNVSGSFHEARLSDFESLRKYYISVSAFTRVGNGDQFSNTVIFSINESVPDAIQNLQCNVTSWQSIIVEWDPPIKSGGIITYYILIFGNNVQKILSRNRTYTFTELQSNTSYHFSITAANSLGQGESKNCTITTLAEAVPSAPENLEVVGIQSTFVILRWIWPDIIPGHLRFFKINLQLRSASCMDWENRECIEAEKIEDHEIDNDNNTMEIIVSRLKKFRWYRFRVSAGTNAGFSNYSDWISAKTTVGYPADPPENVTVTVKSHDVIEVAWEIPTDPPSYLIDVILTDSGDTNMTIVRTGKQNKTCEIAGLQPFTRYTIIVIAFTGREEEARIHGKASEPIIVRTLETLPKDAPKNFTLQKIPDEVTKVYASFLPPSMPNGNIHGYQAIIHKEGETSELRVNNLKVVDNNRSLIAVIEGLKGGNTYTIWVRAVNGAGIGPQTSEQTVTMDVKAPPKPKLKPIPALDKNGLLQVTSTTITIRMPVCYFTDEHGSIKKIQIIVTEIRAMNDKNISTWYDAYVRKPKPYFANEGFTNPPCSRTNTVRENANEETYTIGAENSCQHNAEQICNGPLKNDKEYLFKFRATNFQKQFTDSDYSDPVKTLAEGLSGRTIEIILAVTLCVLSIVLLVIVGYVIARIRQKQKEGGTYSPRDAEIIDTKFKLDQMIAVTDLELKEEKLTRYSSLFFRRKEIYVIQLLSYRKSLKPINKKLFLQHVEDLCVNNNLKFQEEFAELPKLGQELTSSDADLPWNRTKNRFANIKPYNNNRVKLMLEAGVPGSDFINASYVSGYLCPNEFIATQGPLPGTVADFWRMIWETRSQSIVMLTHCFEKGRIRCHQYWPEDNKPVTVFGDIVITKLAENIQADWTIRELKIEKYGDFMMVTHFNFTSWPEHGVPETSAALIHFVKLIRANRANDNTPIVVHCSAGVGRTGVFIALDHLIQHVNHHDFVDIFGFVADLRSERMCMVQNLAQYMFLHQCALDLLNNKGNSRSLWFVNYAALQKMDSLDTMEGDVELEWEETTM
ncbi:phosphatidylinositol phosphatase PTPRQ [Pristis pectinata]|uniref:phosphatidylinositol phosphatase PTPRQ n=1 Tax=Pristis pectinata TaxID=685728 RepID=UPI00223CD5BB|nr:phosphatidylinositol phosphatase PTPRQ [Pristis pectinata]